MVEHDIFTELGNDAHSVHIVNVTVIPDDVFASVLEKTTAVSSGIAVLIGLPWLHAWRPFIKTDADFAGG